MADVGDNCDDGDSNTVNDNVSSNCECVGVPLFDCPSLEADFGDACDDGDDDTENDEITENCECEGEEIITPEPTPDEGEIEGAVWNDVDGDGNFDNDEEGIGGVIISLYNEDGDLLATTMTNSNGEYSFDDLADGEYVVEVGEIDDDLELSTAGSYEVEVEDGETVSGASFGFEEPATTCEADAGTIELDGSDDAFCFGSQIEVDADFDSPGAGYAYAFLLVGEDDKIEDVSFNGTLDALESPGEYQVYGLSYDTGEVSTPNVGSELDDVLEGDCWDLSDPIEVTIVSSVQISLDIECDENTGIYTLTASFSGGMPEYAVENGGDPDDFFYNVFGDINGQYTVDEDVSVELAENASYSITAVDMTGCSDEVADTPPACSKTAVEFMGLNGRVEAVGNYLYWATASESNNSHFEVERSLDGMNFTSIDKVEAVGNSTVLSLYEFTDFEAPAGTAYYRIAAIDFDGKVDQSNILMLERETGHFGITHIAPIPATEQITVSFNTHYTGQMTITVVDVAGKMIKVLELETNKGLNQVGIDVSEYSSGVYFLNLTDGNEVSTKRFVVE